MRVARRLGSAGRDRPGLSRRQASPDTPNRFGLRWTAAFPSDDRKAVTIYVSRKEDIARMDEFIGPKA